MQLIKLIIPTLTFPIAHVIYALAFVDNVTSFVLRISALEFLFLSGLENISVLLENILVHLRNIFCIIVGSSTIFNLVFALLLFFDFVSGLHYFQKIFIYIKNT